MTRNNFPDGPGTRIDDIERRVRILETSARVGFNGTRNAQSSAVAFAASFGSWEYAPAGATFVDDTGVVQAGYPQLTMRLPRLTKVEFGGRLEGLANGATYRSKAGTLGVQLNGVDATLTAGINYQLNAVNHDVPQSSSAVLRLAAGTYTLKLGVLWENTVPLGANLPRLSSAFLIVSPISVA